MGIIGRLKSLADGAPLFGDTSDCSAARARITCAAILCSDTYHKERRSLLSARYSADSTHCSVTGDKFKNKEGRCQHMTLAAIKCRSILWCNFMINGLLRLVKRENQIKFDCGLAQGANYTHLCAAGEGKFRGNSNNCMQKPRKKHGSEYFCT